MTTEEARQVQEPCDDSISKQAALDTLDKNQCSSRFCEEHHIVNSINLGMADIVVTKSPPITLDVVSREVIDDIIAEIKEIVTEEAIHDRTWTSGLQYALKIIDKHINGKEKYDK